MALLRPRPGEQAEHVEQAEDQDDRDQRGDIPFPGPVGVESGSR